jgi:hypothetical protein
VERKLRLSFLKDTPFLGSEEDCTCEACAGDWPTIDKLESCPPGELEAIMLAQSKLTSDLLPFAFSVTEDLERRNLYHTREFHQLQERIRMELARQGNVGTVKPTSHLERLRQIFCGED